MLMGFPQIPFRLCDFWSIHDETTADGAIVVRGELPGGTHAIAHFAPQNGPRGSWAAYRLEEI